MPEYLKVMDVTVAEIWPRPSDKIEVSLLLVETCGSNTAPLVRVWSEFGATIDSNGVARSNQKPC